MARARAHPHAARAPARTFSSGCTATASMSCGASGVPLSCQILMLPSSAPDTRNTSSFRCSSASPSTSLLWPLPPAAAAPAAPAPGATPAAAPLAASTDDMKLEPAAPPSAPPAGALGGGRIVCVQLQSTGFHTLMVRSTLPEYSRPTDCTHASDVTPRTWPSRTRDSHAPVAGANCHMRMRPSSDPEKSTGGTESSTPPSTAASSAMISLRCAYGCPGLCGGGRAGGRARGMGAVGGTSAGWTAQRRAVVAAVGGGKGRPSPPPSAHAPSKRAPAAATWRGSRP